MGEIVQVDSKNAIMVRTVRTEVDDDKNFIMSSWLRAFKGSFYAGPIQNDLYYKVYQTVLERIMARPNCHVLMASNPKDEDQIFGYLVVENAEDRIVHWIYVKREFRGFGIARTLLERCGIHRDTEFLYTFRVKNTPSYIQKWKARFAPQKVCQKGK